MKINGIDFKPYLSCFCCGKRFDGNDIPYTSYVLGKGGSRFLCVNCAEAVNAEIPVCTAAVLPIAEEKPATETYTVTNVDPEELREQQDAQLKKNLENMFGPGVKVNVVKVPAGGGTATW